MNHIRLILCAASFSVIALFAQEFRATLTGTVTDPSGAVLPGVKITATSIDRNVTVSTISNEAGAFSFPPLIPGQYTITAAHAGFNQFVREGIVLRLQDKVDLPIQLEVGDTSTNVRVTGELPLVETATATTGQVIGSKLISELPLNGRNPYLLTILSVGVMYGNPPAITRTFDTGATNSFTTGGPATSGQLGNNEFILDGVPGLNFVPSVSATQEFKVQLNTYDAEYGRSAGANVNVSTKSGTNSLHGETYEFLRNSKLDSNNFFLNRSGIRKGVFQFNLFGL